MRKGLDQVYDFNSNQKLLFYWQFLIESEHYQKSETSVTFHFSRRLNMAEKQLQRNA